MQYAQMIAIPTLAGFLFTRDRAPFPRTRETYLLLMLWGIYTFSTATSLYPELAWPQWERVSKILLFTFVTLLLFQDRARLRYLLLTVALSIGFYGLKGGLFTLRTGGQYQVLFPDDTMMGNNTGFGLLLNMTLPMFFFFAREEANPWLRRLFWATFFLSIPATVFTYSRGAMIGLGVVLLCLLAKTGRKGIAVAGLAAGVVLLVTLAPEGWFARMQTLRQYEEDASAMGRFDAWLAFSRVGLDRPLLGAGFWGPTVDELFLRYHPTAPRSRDAHNIFFNILGEHGVIALAIFVGLIVCCILSLRGLRSSRGSARPPDWVSSYAHMLEVSLVGYVVTGLFLSASYLDLFYHVVAFTILLKVLADREAEGEPNPPGMIPAVAGMRG
jgi:probable O-glycosylation ligase (exosortase A-associated)